MKDNINEILVIYYYFGQSKLQEKVDLTGIINLDLQTGSGYEF